MEGDEEFSLFKRQPIDLVCWGRNTKIRTDGIVFEVSRIVRNSSFIVGSVLGVKVNRSILLSHHYLSIVVGQNLEFDDFTIESSQAFQGQFRGIINFELRSVYASGYYVAFILSDFYLVGGDGELKILDEFYPAPVFIIISEWFVGLFSFLDELRIAFACWHVVGLNPIDLCNFVHQQSTIIMR